MLLLEEQLPDDLKAVTEIEGSPCLGACKRDGHGKAQSANAPFAQIDGAVIERASVQKIIDYIRGIDA